MDVFFIISGFGVGLLVGLTGVGGGALMTPLLIFGFGITPAVAVGTDLIFAAITKANGVWVHASQGTVDWRIVRRLMSGSLPAALITLAVLGQIDTHTEQAQHFITTTLGLALILTASTLLWRRWLRGGVLGNDAASGGAGLQQAERQQEEQQQIEKRQALATVATGVVLGVLVTLTSVGAGALGAAVLFWLYPRLSAARVVGTDLAHAVPLATLAGLGHWQMGTVDLALLGALLIGSLPGIYLGSRLSAALPEQWLRPMLATLLLVIGFRLVA